MAGTSAVDRSILWEGFHLPYSFPENICFNCFSIFYKWKIWWLLFRFEVFFFRWCCSNILLSKPGFHYTHCDVTHCLYFNHHTLTILCGGMAEQICVWVDLSCKSHGQPSINNWCVKYNKSTMLPLLQIFCYFIFRITIFSILVSLRSNMSDSCTFSSPLYFYHFSLHH